MHDGPGLRTVVYLKGCHLDCPWCHNIEGKLFEQEFSFDKKRCIARTVNYKACSLNCPFKDGKTDFSHSVYSEIAGVCPSKAVKLVGRDYSAEKLADQVLDDIDFFRQTGGGVTFSGGEPMAQYKFLFACADILKAKGVHLALETSGFWQGAFIDEVIKKFDLILFDLKHVDFDKFKRFTGANNGTVLSNLTQLLSANVRVELRITLIPGFNDNDADLISIADRLKSCGCLPPVRLLLFHRLAASKQTLFKRTYPYAKIPLLPLARISEATKLLRDKGLEVL